MTVTETSHEEQRPDTVGDGGSSEPIRIRALIVGTGFSGIGAGIALQKMGVPFHILEKAGEMGGTWRDNTYPGAACDVPTHLYSFSFEPRSNWDQLFSRQPEIFDYLKEVGAKYGLYRHVTFNTRVTRGYWDEDEYRWHVFTDGGQEYICQFLISGVGALHIPSIPEIEGLDRFEGPVFHSAQWNHDYDLTGKKVAVIGTGASAIQFVPEIVGKVGELKLFQRTPPWVLPRTNVEFGALAKRAFAGVPGLRALFRSGMYFGAEAGAYAMNRRPALLKGIELLGRAYIKSQISDPEVRRKVTPDYRAGCKRLLGSATYYKAIENRKTELVTEAITRVTTDGVVTSDGIERKVDAIIFGTGFSGIGAGIALQKMGVPFHILEKAGEMGGTWRDNTYPGAACDVPTHLYSFSFEPRSTWDRLFSQQPEIFDYLKEVGAKYGLYRHVTFNTRVTRGYWDEDEYRWHVFTDGGQEYICQFLISGVGALHIPSIPEIEGLDRFEGPVFHSAQWNHDYDLTGKKVAVIGTGASAIQFVPEIVGKVGELKLFQRTPPWVLPRTNVEFGALAKRAFAGVPGLRALFRSGMYFGARIHQ
ncbi:Probable monooxygenase [Mycobacteroides abscessus]|nr:Probable monooxygenase [Mycobacteroides abscessus]